jgi:acyl-[acyl carrier protein]--UDP-N-acetylglucosamine O-acyltransferase
VLGSASLALVGHISIASQVSAGGLVAVRQTQSAIARPPTVTMTRLPFLSMVIG